MKTARIVSIIIILLLIIWFALPGYVRKALIYQKPGIDDYHLFYNQVVDKGQTTELPVSYYFTNLCLSDSAERYFDRFKTAAFIVLKNDSLIYERYWGNFTDSTLGNSFSMAKSIVAILACIAMDEGYIKSFDQPVSDFIPGFDHGLKAKLTVKHLLTMSAALDWNENYTNALTITSEAYYGDNLEQLVLQTDLKAEPGHEFEYQSGATQLLAIVIEKATGVMLNTYASEKLWKKLGARHQALWSLDSPGGIEKAFCCFNAVAADFARIGLLMLHHGKSGNQTIVSDSLVNNMLKPASHLTYHGKPVDFYGLQWWIGSYRSNMMYYARGILGQYIIIIPAENLVIVRLGNKRDKKKRGIHPDDIFHYVDAAYEASALAKN